VLQGYGSEASGVIRSLYKDLHFAPGDGEAHGFDLGAANEMLDQAGYRDTNGDKVREMPDGSRPLRFRLFARTESNESQQSHPRAAERGPRGRPPRAAGAGRRAARPDQGAGRLPLPPALPGPWPAGRRPPPGWTAAAAPRRCRSCAASASTTPLAS
jgi:hypothetical protein